MDKPLLKGGGWEKVLRETYALVDRGRERLFLDYGIKAGCGNGCAWCCYLKVDIRVSFRFATKFV